MSDQALLAIMAAIALTFEIIAIQKLAPVIWESGDVQVVSLCAGADPNTRCGLNDPAPKP